MCLILQINVCVDSVAAAAKHVKCIDGVINKVSIVWRSIMCLKGMSQNPVICMR